jgi:copper(I)-binding protein
MTLAYFRALTRSAYVPRFLPAFASLLLLCAATFGPSLAQAQSAAGLLVQNAWARKPPGVDTAAVYFELKNPGSKSVTVVGATSAIATQVMVHETSLVEGQSRKRMREKIPVPAGKTVAFAPEGLHVMLIGFKYDVVVGDEIPVTLLLEDGSKVALRAAVRPLDAK